MRISDWSSDVCSSDLADAAAVCAGCTGGLSFSFISIAAAVVAIATKTTAPSRARVLESMVVPSVSTVEEHSGIARLIAGPGREKATTLLASLLGSGRPLGLRQRLRASVGGYDRR